VQSAGDDLICLAVPDTRHAHALASSLRLSGNWLEVVAGIESVVVRFDIARLDRTDAEHRLRDACSNIQVESGQERPLVEIPIVYGGEFGPDLALVCEELGLGKDEFIAMHTGSYTVDMLGFIPGFAYIGGLGDRLNVGRLAEPRQYVPGGSIGIAGGRTGIYSLSGPGGWPLIGRTSRKLFDPTLDDPFTLAAGATVVFTAVDKF